MDDPILITRGNLPHISQFGYTVFVTFRLADSLPARVVGRIAAEYESFKASQPAADVQETKEKFGVYRHNRLERYLDEAHGRCVLRQIMARRIVADVIFHYHDTGEYVLHTFIVMPNHVHLLFSLADARHMQRLIASVKRFTAVRINRVLGLSGQLWQREYFDRYIRSQDHFERAYRYIRNNGLYLPAAEFTFWNREMPRSQLGWRASSCSRGY